MPLDGAALAGVVHELERLLVGGRVDKIIQPEADEVVIGIRAGGVNHKLMLTANASAPRVHLSGAAKVAPLNAPLFCMVLRKHVSGGRVLAVRQPDFERIIIFEIENRTEMGDTARKTLIIEMMGKHSNIILTDHAGKVLDAIKHVPPSLSAVRTILPNAMYEAPPNRGKENPLQTKLDVNTLAQTGIAQAIFAKYNGISPLFAAEICARAKIHPEAFKLSPEEGTQLTQKFDEAMEKIKNNTFEPHMYYSETGKPLDFTPWPFLHYNPHRAEACASFSQMLEKFYEKRDTDYRLQQRTTDLRKLVNTLLERARKKAFTHEKSLADTHNRDTLRIKGELLTAFLHKIERGAASFTAENFYEENTMLEIALDPTLTPSENAQRYFRQYNKQKRANAALRAQISQNNDDIAYLESVSAALQNANAEEDIAEIRAELAGQGFVKRRPLQSGKKQPKQRESKPLHYTTPDGYDVYVGKNNTQNDQLTLRTARATDIWLHTKDIPGSHVILLTRGDEPSETAILFAANLAAYHSKARESSNVPVDYVARKHVRKPAGAKPGYVIYDYHKTVYVTPEG
ncbi:MAG: NFACT family protein [Defluviitaleaceae bacterium]|nr:NFACT family protein [Defluviitaleaceae bacterium]